MRIEGEDKASCPHFIGTILGFLEDRRYHSSRFGESVCKIRPLVKSRPLRATERGARYRHVRLVRHYDLRSCG